MASNQLRVGPQSAELQSKKNESMAVDRLSKMMEQYESKEKESFTLRNDIDKMLFKLKESEMEIQRLNQHNKMISHRYEEVVKEKMEALELAETELMLLPHPMLPETDALLRLLRQSLEAWKKH